MPRTAILAARRRPHLRRAPVQSSLTIARRRLTVLGVYLTLVLLLLVFAPQAHAAGGAHVVDDANVETPGVCHLESWVTAYDGERGLANLSPACTRKAWPRLEIGGAAQHLWDGGDDTTIGPTLKLNLRPTESGLGLGLIGAGAWSVHSGRLETASLIVPASRAVTDRVRVNLNAGWVYDRASAHPHTIFYGGQIEADVARDLMLMVEAFGRDHGPPGGQIGLRWNPGGGRVDLDLLAGRRIDGASPKAITLGLTVRR